MKYHINRILIGIMILIVLTLVLIKLVNHHEQTFTLVENTDNIKEKCLDSLLYKLNDRFYVINKECIKDN